MKKVTAIFAAFLMMMVAMPVNAQLKLGRLAGAAAKGVKAMTISDAQMAAYVKESVDWMDTHNKVSDADSPYTIRLNKLTEGLKDADGIPLNVKVYEVIDVNAFACPDGSVRVFSSLMDMMDDDELIGIIGHEIGHMVKRHSKNAFKQELLTGALKDVVASTSDVAAALTDSQLGALSESLASAKFSQKQEKEADDCGYDFLVQNGRNPWGMVKAFEKMQKMEEEAGAGSRSAMEKMFSSHPDTPARIKHMSERATKDGYTRP